MEGKEEGGRVVCLLGLGQRQAQQHGRVSVEDEDAHIGLASQFQDVRQVVWHALAAVLLPKLLGGDAIGVLQGCPEQLGLISATGSMFFR